MPDLLILGAGLAGLSAARDLTAGGADVLVLEARQRVGDRVEQVALSDGRLVKLGGHARREPPFHACGSDFWVAGYMEGAVRTGRAAAAAALAA